MQLRAGGILLAGALSLGPLPCFAQSGASIAGRVAYAGVPPSPQWVKMTPDPWCAKVHPDGVEARTVEVSANGGLAQAFVWIKSGVKGPTPASAEPAVLDQRGCEFDPHIVVVRAGQPLSIRTSDDTLHNVHPRPAVNREFNIGQPRPNMVAQKTLDQPEIGIPVGCDIHPWMRAYLMVVDHPYFAVTDADGSFEIKDVPPGDYEVAVWHERLGTQSLRLTVIGAEAARANFVFRR